MFVLEVEMVAFFLDLVDLTEAVHVQLPHERLDFVVPEEERQHSLFELLLVLDQNFAVVLAPADHILEFVLLNECSTTSKIEYILMMNSGMQFLMQTTSNALALIY